MITTEIRINPRFESLLPALTNDEYDSLRQSLIEEGCREPIIIWNDWIVDGHNRFEICNSLEIDFDFREMDFESEDDAIVWMIDNQGARRNLTDGWKYKLALTRKEILAAKGREKYKATVGRPPANKSLSINDNDFLGDQDGFIPDTPVVSMEKHNTRDEIAKDLGWSTGKTAQADYVWKHGDDKIKEDLLTGEVSVSGAYKSLHDKGKTSDGKSVHVAQNSGENEWYTPPEYIEAAIQVMGAIDCDPASSEIANKAVGASIFYTKEDDGLSQEWGARVWMNPPYSNALCVSFCSSLVEKYLSCEVEEACALVNNATETKWFCNLASQASAVCFPSGRVRFLDPQGNPGAPLQGQSVVYFGKHSDEFVKQFSKFGWCAIICR